MSNNENNLVTDEIISDNSESSEKKKIKKYNGFLRNNNKKFKVKKKIKEEFSNETLQSSDIVALVNEVQPLEVKFEKIVEKLSEDEYRLFYILRQKTGVIEDDFWICLKNVLNTKKFDEIKINNMNLLEYCALYDSKRIFNQLLENFGLSYKVNEIEKIFNFCLTKSDKILSNLFNYYDNRFKSNEEFINHVIEKTTLFSYKDENNKIIVQWLSKNEKNLEQLTNKMFINNNVSLLFTALSNETYFNYLKNNKNKFNDQIEKHFRAYSINNILNSKFYQAKNSKSENYELSMTSWSSNTDDKVKSLSKENNNNVEVIVRKKKFN
jgi:hypothetical protein